jgi:hypothetical protein
MRKGLTGLQNIRFIRLCAEFGVAPSYNILVGFPGEVVQDYQSMAELLRRVRHLPPPSGLASLVQIHRFSPFHDQMDEFGFEEVRPAAHYDHLIPPTVLAPEAYAYFFTRAVPLAVHEHLRLTNEVVGPWLESSHRISARLGPGFMEVTDSEHGRVVLDELSTAIMLASDEVRSRAQLLGRLSQHLDVSPRAAEAAMAQLEARNWLVADGGHLVCTVPYAEPHAADDLAAWAKRWLPAALVFLRETVIPPMKLVQA